MKAYLKSGVIIMTMLASLAVWAQEEQPSAPKTKLRVGDPAPALATGEWLKGEPVKGFEKGTIYIVEFWATWCPPCRASIPHLTELQKKYKDVVIIGQNCSEMKQDKVADFVKKMGDKMDYRVALDDVSKEKRGSMSKLWMEAAGAQGIPTAFVVGKDIKIAWMGHPMELDEVLPDIVAGKFDPKKNAEKKEAMMKDQKELMVALRGDDVEAALKAADAFTAKHPEAGRQMTMLKFQLLLHKKDYDKAYALGGEIREALKDSPDALNEVAWTLTTGKGIEKRDLDLAEKLAARAVEVTKGENASYLDTLARVQFDKGQTEKAIETETKALGKATAEEKEGIEKTLEQYKAKK